MFNSKHLKYFHEWSDAIFQVDVILIASQALGPADGSHYIINYFGAGLNSFSESVNDVCFRLAMPLKNIPREIIFLVPSKPSRPTRTFLFQLQ